MDDVVNPSFRRGLGGLSLAAVGAAVSGFALITYFLVVPRWPDLRDSGVPSVLLSVLGAAVSLAGLAKTFRARKWRAGSAACLAVALLCAAFLTFYIFVLSYHMPSAENAPAVGAKAPSFRLLDPEGRERTLEEFRGRRLLLVFFRGHW